MQRDGLAALLATGNRLHVPTHRMQIAKTLIRHARWDEAHAELDLALADVEATGEALHLAEIRRVRAACWLSSGQRDAAAADLDTAISVAHRQQARPFEARARADLLAMRSVDPDEPGLIDI
jgi:hypothetical protein